MASGQEVGGHGPKGPKGDTGATGATGATGPTGSAGALAPAPVYANTTAGLAGTSSGQYFTVPSTSPGETFVLYLNSAGSASLVRRFQSALNVYADSVAGSDAADGLSEATAKATVTAAVTLLGSDNGTLWLKRGSRFKEAAGILLSRPTHVRAYGGGERPIIDGSRVLANANFSAVGGYANVYQIAVDFAALGFATMPFQLYSQSFFQFFEGVPGADARFAYANGFFNFIQSWVNQNTDDATRLAYVRDHPGTFHVRKSDGSPVPTDTVTDPGSAFIFYVHLPDSGNPITNAKEYSVSGVQMNHWKQQYGGSCEDLWLTRSGHRNGVAFEDVTQRRCRVDHYPVHGGFWNSCYAEDVESYGVYRAGACFHGYRQTATVGSDKGNTFVRCTAEEGAWGFYSHGNGGPAPQLWARLTDCVTRHVVRPYDVNTVRGVTVLRGRNYNCTTAVSGNGGAGATYTDTFWSLPTALPADYTDSVFFYAAGTLRNCMIVGGLAGVGYRITNTAGALVLENTSILCLPDVLYQSASTTFTLTNSVIPSSLGSLVISATNSYVPGRTLDGAGTDLTIPQIASCFSPRRRQVVGRTMVASGAGGWVTSTNGASMNWIFTASSVDVEVATSTTNGFAAFGPNTVVRVPAYDGSNDFVAKFVSWNYGYYGTNRHRVVFATAPAATATKTTSTFDVLRATVPIWPKTATSMYCRPDTTQSVITLYGNAAEVALVVAGTPLRLLFDNGDRLIDAGIYFVQTVTADAGGPRLTLDRAVIYPVPFAATDWANYKTRDNQNWGDGSWLQYHAMPRLEVRLPAGKQDRTVFSIALPSGLTLTPHTRGYLPLSTATGGTAPPVQTNYVDSPWHGFVDDVTVEPQNTTEANGGVATLTMEQYFFDLEARWLQAEDGKVRHAPDSYLYGKGVGCTL